MRRAGLAVVAAVVVLVSGCGGSDDGGGESSSVPYGARTCSDWSGRMDDTERWDAAEELLVNAKGTDGAEGDRAPSASTLKQFSSDLDTLCGRRAGDEMLAPLADELYTLNRAYYSI
jgi:hypothetical protein